MNLGAGLGVLVAAIAASFIASETGLNDWRRVGLIIILLGVSMSVYTALKAFVDKDRS